MNKSLQLEIIMLVIAALFISGCGTDETTDMVEPEQETQEPETESEQEMTSPVDDPGDIPGPGEPPVR